MPYGHEMRGQRGYSIITDPSAKKLTTEEDTYTCGHCGKVVWVQPLKGPLGGRCTCCDHLICLACVGKGCRPLQKQLELMERRRQYVEVLDRPLSE